VVNERDFTTDELAEMILVAHQRQTSRSCLCGWDELGRSHAKHQVAMLRKAGLISEVIQPTDL
jgi:hypothetical protein